MAARHEIRCIKKSDRNNPHERILRIGGINPDGSRWSLSQEEAIRGIEEKKWEFYVTQNGRTTDVIIAISPYGHKYIKTVADGDHPNNLLSLPECP
ncbi:MAG: DUF3892 domain-containing protein [Candidatus Omnitrophota bacterium]